MYIAQFETLIWISRLGSVRKAAVQLGTSQPAASSRIRELEQHLGISLFVREKRPMQLTPEGREILRMAERIVDLAKTMEGHATANVRQPIYGTVRMGANHAVAATWLPRLLKLMYERLPGVEIELVVETTDHVQELLRRGDIDIGFVLGAINDKAIGYNKLYEMSIDWVAHKSIEGIPAVLTPQRITRFPILTDSVGLPVHRAVVNWFRAGNVQPRRIDICSHPQSRLNLAAEGEWLVAMPASALLTYSRASEFRVYPCKPALEAMEIGVAYRLAADAGPTLQLVMKLCTEVVTTWRSEAAKVMHTSHSKEK